MASSDEQPICISIVVCDAVYRDEATKKLVIVGVFNNIAAGKVPCKHHRLCVLFTITNANGRYDLALAIEHEKTGQHVMEAKGPLVVNDPLAVSDVSFTMTNLVFPGAGKYWVKLTVDGQIIQQRPLFVTLKPKPDRGPSMESNGS